MPQPLAQQSVQVLIRPHKMLQVETYDTIELALAWTIIYCSAFNEIKL